MKNSSFYLWCAFVFSPFAMNSQVGLITWEVNMANETVSPEGVYLAGGDYFGIPGDNPMSDNDGDGVWTITISMPLEYTGAYTFTNGACMDWSCKENIVGQSCAFGTWSDRELPTVTGDATYSTCFSQCSTDGSCSTGSVTDVTFRVDMSEQIVTAGVFLSAGFDGWGSIPMTDEDGDNVFEHTESLESGSSYEYLFQNGLGGSEVFDADNYAECTLTSGAFTNRVLNFGAADAFVTDAFCFNSCAACESSDDLPWTHDCNISACDSWVFGNGADNTGSPWENIDLNFECTLDGPAGPYNQWAGGTGDFSAVSAMNSTTASNGLLIIDSDLFGAESIYIASWIENSWVQTSTPINCGVTDNVRMSFQTRYHCWDNGASDDSEKCLVEISRDGVNWPSIETFSEIDGTVDYGDGEFIPSRWEVFPGYETGSQTDNPSFIDIDVSSAAGGQPQVWIRFRWSGTWGYSWEIDDIVVEQLPANDIRIESYVSTTDYLNTGVYELGAIPQSQLPSYQAGVSVANIGYLDQTGVQLHLSADGQALSSSSPMNVLYPETQTLQVLYSLENLELGPHTMEFEVEGDVPDENPSNNFAERTFEITDFQMGRDNGTMTGAFPAEGTNDFIALNPFVMMEDATIYAIDVALVSGSENGAIVIAHLYDPSNPNYLSEQYGGLIASTNEQGLAADVVNTGVEDEIVWYTLTLEQPYAIQGGQPIAVAFEHYGGSNVQIWESQYTLDQTSFTYGPFGSGMSYDWYYTNEVPMVRLNLDPNALSTGYTGCTDSAACNYSLNASEDDGSCEYDSCAGCMDDEACNFDTAAIVENNEECTYPGCQDPAASNYDSSAGCSGECIYLTYDCTSIGDAGWASEEIGLFPEWQQAMVGVSWAGEWVFNVPSTVIEPQSGGAYGVHHVEWAWVDGLPDWVNSSEFTLGDLEAISQHCIAASGIPSAPGIHEITALGEVFISIFGQEFSIGEQTYSAWLEVTENPNPIPGCLYATAVNFVNFATIDNGSCLFAGCTDENAVNFSPLATIDDGSCGEGCDPSGDSSCTTDVNDDGVVNVSDLLLLLGEFGIECE